MNLKFDKVLSKLMELDDAAEVELIDIIIDLKQVFAKYTLDTVEVLEELVKVAKTEEEKTLADKLSALASNNTGFITGTDVISPANSIANTNQFLGALTGNRLLKYQHSKLPLTAVVDITTNIDDSGNYVSITTPINPSAYGQDIAKAMFTALSNEIEGLSSETIRDISCSPYSCVMITEVNGQVGSANANFALMIDKEQLT